MYDLRLYGAAEAFKNEKAAYGALAALQGSALPRLIATGILAHLSVPVVVTCMGGQPLQTRLTKARPGAHRTARPCRGSAEKATQG